MRTTLSHATVAAQPGWFLAVFTNSDGIYGVRCEQIIAWEIQRTTSSNGLVTRFPVPITAEVRLQYLGHQTAGWQICVSPGGKRRDKRGEVGKV
jgi:hypothetical protein